MNNLKIGLCGAQGVGKTTLAHRLANELDLPLITGQARKAADLMGLEKLPDPKTEILLSNAFQNLCLNLQLEAENKHYSFISDRTTIDNALYYLMNNSFNGLPANNMDYYRLCNLNAKKYDLLIYVPIEFPIRDDGFRDSDGASQFQANFLLKCLLGEMRPNGYITVTGTIKERVSKVMEHIKSIRGDKIG